MKRKLVLVTLLTLILVTTITTVVFMRFRVANQSGQIKTPFTRPDQTHELIDQLEKSGVNIETAPLVLGDTIEASISGFRVLFAGESDLPTQVRALQLVLPRLKMDGKTVKEIDLRFNKVIIR